MASGGRVLFAGMPSSLGGLSKGARGRSNCHCHRHVTHYSKGPGCHPLVRAGLVDVDNDGRLDKIEFTTVSERTKMFGYTERKGKGRLKKEGGEGGGATENRQG